MLVSLILTSFSFSYKHFSSGNSFTNRSVNYLVTTKSKETSSGDKATGLPKEKRFPPVDVGVIVMPKTPIYKYQKFLLVSFLKAVNKLFE